MSKQQTAMPLNVTAPPESTALPAVQEPAGTLTPMQIISNAVIAGAPIETLEKLMALQERWEKNEARKAYEEAIADAKSEIKPILKTRSGHNSKYEDLADIANAVDPILSKHGLSYRYRAKQEDKIFVTCVLSHRLGHSEESTLNSAPDTGPGRNNLQAIGSALTYLQRYTLKLVLGLAATKDDDGKAAGADDFITADQAAELRAMIEARGGSVEKFCKFAKVENLESIYASRFAAAKQAIERAAKP